MEDVTSRFTNLLEQILIPDFCSNLARGMAPSGFRSNLAILSEIDMVDFLRGWEAQLFEHVGNGLYRAPKSGALEQFFWSGRKTKAPRTFTLWTEPIIALGVLARLHFDFGWPTKLIGTQSKRDWAFDVVGYKAENDQHPLIACEVKKSREEIDALISYMQLFGRQSSHTNEHLKTAQTNAVKKVKALRAQRPPIFWAVGPDRYEKVFSVQYQKSDVIELEPISIQALSRGTLR